nr:MAG TPA: hypothetical protein [Caudoviricetes sp.]
MKRETWIIVLFAALYIATFSWFQYQHNRVMQKAKEADAMAKLLVLDQRMYRHQFSVRDMGRALEAVGMIDSMQYHRMWRCIDDMRILVWDYGMLEQAIPSWHREREIDASLTWHEIMENGVEW